MVIHFLELRKTYSNFTIHMQNTYPKILLIIVYTIKFIIWKHTYIKFTKLIQKCPCRCYWSNEYCTRVVALCEHLVVLWLVTWWTSENMATLGRQLVRLGQNARRFTTSTVLRDSDYGGVPGRVCILIISIIYVHFWWNMSVKIQYEKGEGQKR